jgi:hypothetical protein
MPAASQRACREERRAAVSVLLSLELTLSAAVHSHTGATGRVVWVEARARVVGSRDKR